MKLHRGRIRLSATDLASHLGCRHLTALELSAARGELKRPHWENPTLEALFERGREHERQYLDGLRSQGLTVEEFPFEVGPGAAAAALDLMRQGVDVIAQPVLEEEGWHGRADVLLLVAKPSRFGDWSYEVVDTKLARETKAGTILQLCLYSDLLASLQGALPESMRVVTPLAQETYRLADFGAYYRRTKERLRQAADQGQGSTYPEPCPQCDVCRWWQRCDRQRRDDDHLSLVAGLSRLHQLELEERDIGRLEQFAQHPVPLSWKPKRGARDTYHRLREQARVQWESRGREAPLWELLDAEPDRGLARLPEPSPGDVFFDFEGDPFVGNQGREYLFGYVLAEEAGSPDYHAHWALTEGEERRVFDQFIGFLMKRWERFPGMHVYHFSPYEPAAIKRLMGRFSRREEEIDRLLRGGVFVDLLGVVRQGLRVGVESYSIKKLEPVYGFIRDEDLRQASLALRSVERSLELGAPEAITPQLRGQVETYNKDDCLSTLELRDWLEERREELTGGGVTVERPRPEDGEPNEAVSERQAELLAAMEPLIAGVPEERADRSEEQQATWLLANMLDWHHREEKVAWWEYFRLAAMSESELFDEKAALADLEFVERVGGTDQCPIHRYRFPVQDTDVGEGDSLRKMGGDPVGSVDALDTRDRIVDIKKCSDEAGSHPLAVFSHKVVTAKAQAQALLRLARWVAENGIDAPGGHRSARDLLLGLAPRLKESHSPGTPLQQEGEPSLDAARRLSLVLDSGVLPIQGPPGAGKTFTGARMICQLVRAGKRVGITAVSHKVIRNLLDGVVGAAEEEGLSIHCVQKVSERPEKYKGGPIRETGSNSGVVKALDEGWAQVVAGTAWLWARPELEDSVDVLFVDEAGQMSLANTVAVAQAAKSLVLLGDPQQLEQPLKASHPDGTEVSALEHLLGDGQTISPDRGLFLAETWRLHPAISALTSELFYESRLTSRAGNENQALVGETPFEGAGLWFSPVEHEGNQGVSIEEVDRVAGFHSGLLSQGLHWIDREGTEAALTEDDILIVAPYNAQVGALGERLPTARIGTVDKFQGQAPVVIYSMATSSPAEAPRGMEFLFSLNRLNVATSRARCACILVGSPALFEPECRTPRQLRLANAFCRYLELAETPGPEGACVAGMQTSSSNSGSISSTGGEPAPLERSLSRPTRPF